MHITKVRQNNKTISQMQWEAMMIDLKKALKEQGFDFYIDKEKPLNSFNFSQVRLSGEYVKKYGYNVSPYEPHRRGRILGWKDWVKFNNTVNQVLNKHRISANVSSLGGKFKIRKGGIAYGESDWEGLAEENVGSMVQPVARRDAWMSEKDYYGA